MPRDVSALLAFISELKDLDDALAFPPRTLALLNRLIAADFVGYSVLDPVARRSKLQVFHEEGEEGVVWGQQHDGMDELRELWWEIRPTHPVCGRRGKTGNWTQPLKVSDFATLREFRRTPIYDVFYRGELDYWLDMGLPASETETRVLSGRGWVETTSASVTVSSSAPRREGSSLPPGRRVRCYVATWASRTVACRRPCSSESRAS
jgi:hypothetical protein